MQSNDPLVRLDDAVHPGGGEEMSEQDVESLRGAYRDFNAGKPETVLAMADENVEWIEPGGGNAPVGTFTGPQAWASRYSPRYRRTSTSSSAAPRTSMTGAIRSWSRAASRARTRVARSLTPPSPTHSSSRTARSSGSKKRSTRAGGRLVLSPGCAATPHEQRASARNRPLSMRSGTPDKPMTCRGRRDAGRALLAELMKSSRGDWI